MIRKTMPRLEPDAVIGTMRFLRESAGENLFTNSVEIGTLLAGFKPAVSLDLPDSSTVVHEVEERLRGLGFNYTNRAEMLRPTGGFPLPIRTGLIWSIATACELYGGTEDELSRQIAERLAPEHIKKLPGYLLGYADDSKEPNAFPVDVRLRFDYDQDPKHHFRVHFSRARDPEDADRLSRYYQMAALKFVDMVNLRAHVIIEAV